MEIKELQHYRTFEKIGEGINGTVYKAWDTRQNRFVAVKVLKLSPQDTAGRQTLTKVKEIIDISHPQICSIHKVEENNDPPFIVMEFIEGETIEQLLLRQDYNKYFFPDIVIPIVEALKHLHDNEIIHGNLKPSNIMITDNKEIKLLDTGLSLYNYNHSDLTYEVPLEQLRYFPPEQIIDNKPSKKNDLWSLGVILYQIVSGKLPFEGDSIESLSALIISDSPDYNSLRERKIPGVYILLIEKLLAKNPFDCFSKADELLITLKEILSFDKEIVKIHKNKPEIKDSHQYLMVSLLVALLLILWLVVTTYR